jgi:hypothetical protein
MLENPTYTGRLYWNRLDSRAHKQGVGPVVRRSPEEWVEADERHEALVTDDLFERVQTEMKHRSNGHGGHRRRPQRRPFLLRGIVHCSTGHNPLRMQGRSRKGEPTYYTCGYRTSYGDRAAEAVGHGKWQYVREDSLTRLIDSFFATRIFGADRLDYFRAQSSTMASEAQDRDDDKRTRITNSSARSISGSSASSPRSRQASIRWWSANESEPSRLSARRRRPPSPSSKLHTGTAPP